MTPEERKERRDKALAHGVWACPACPDGWWQYMIQSDMNVCVCCGYKGGDPEAWRERWRGV